MLLDEETTTFNNIGKLEQRRSGHSGRVVDINDFVVESDEILLFDPDTKTFNNIGKLEQRRSGHSVSVVDNNDFICS